MTEYQGISLEEQASKFIVETCELLPKSYDSISECMLDAMAYAVHCGSAMEFYIRPLPCQCVADIDALIFEADELAFDGDIPMLPHDVSSLYDTFRCYSIEPYRAYAGFVRLQTMGKLVYNWKYKTYEFRRTSSGNKYLTFDIVTAATNISLRGDCRSIQSHAVRGPAITQFAARGYPVDNVRSIWCPKWPRKAKEWPTRPRNNEWPTIHTISEVLKYGCHIVYVQHRDCRDDDKQWRFSFSIAEVVLLQSLTQVQQIVYHMLRSFAK